MKEQIPKKYIYKFNICTISNNTLIARYITEQKIDHPSTAINSMTKSNRFTVKAANGTWTYDIKHKNQTVISTQHRRRIVRFLLLLH